ncbi:hypothetical protein CLOHYLEM_07147 [[Clostridium] hylemonae DSM 15053]|uniref:Uncharacterized protein n=1 Tax=[Clostridium] hylemonae DSM 15053 TaxID=553973 RepID=C0C4Y1_9FIRM|nr:hypothetical protein CLOHYLEM_07147 [[Clostridium] hylemonae DSM 15053]
MPLIRSGRSYESVFDSVILSAAAGTKRDMNKYCLSAYVKIFLNQK